MGSQVELFRRRVAHVDRTLPVLPGAGRAGCHDGRPVFPTYLLRESGSLVPVVGNNITHPPYPQPASEPVLLGIGISPRNSTPQCIPYFVPDLLFPFWVFHSSFLIFLFIFLSNFDMPPGRWIDQWMETGPGPAEWFHDPALWGGRPGVLWCVVCVLENALHWFLVREG